MNRDMNITFKKINNLLHLPIKQESIDSHGPNRHKAGHCANKLLPASGDINKGFNHVI